MSAFEAVEGELYGDVGVGCFDACVLESGCDVNAAGAADVYFAEGFGVEVEEHEAFEDVGFEGRGASHACLFLAGGEYFEWAVCG